MKLSALLTTLTFLLTATALPSPNADSEISPLDNLFDKRACVYNGCTCSTTAKPGVYCGLCAQVRKKAVNTHAFQCGSGGSCCSYGYRTSCETRGRPCGPDFS
ncbi:hypothetical protein ABW19_dt0208230 [Dactylella cylindrospora]|nr:hypothetical protein ABW19_dt0208230 [Dactylella cylindrospora]